jgi:hypothetical protein
VQNKINYGLKTVREEFSTDVLRQKYHTLMSNLLENEERRLPFQIIYPKGQPPSEEAVQLTRRGRTLWARCFYKQCVFYVKFSQTIESSTKVTIVARTLSVGSAAVVNEGGGGGNIAGYFRRQKGTEKLASIEANSMRQSIDLNLSMNVFGVQLFGGHALQIIDVVTAA